MDSSSPATLQHIADLCGVSKTTVSLALRNHPKISEATRCKVMEVAAEIGYKPNPLVAAHMAMVRNKKTSDYRATIGVVSDWPLEDLQNANDASEHYSESSIARYLLGIRRRAKQLGYQVDVVSVANKGMHGRRVSQILSSRGITGIIMTPLSRSEGTFDLDWEKFATVAMGYSMRSPLVHRVCHDNYTTIRVVTRYLMELGFARVRLAMDIDDDIRVKNLWTGGFMSRAVFDNGYHGARNHVTSEWSKESYLNWLKEERPDAVIGIGDTILKWSTDGGYMVPEDLAIVTVGKIGGPISGYSQNCEMMGEAAVDRVVGLLHTNQVGIPESPQVVLVEGEWSHGETLGRSLSSMGLDSL